MHLTRISKLLLTAAACASLSFATLPAQADIVIDVVPWLAPNAYGSPSWAQAEANAVQGMMNGGVATGSGPSAFTPQSNVTTAQGVVTGFPSWMGQVNPGAVFGPAYAGEYGNRMTFALAIYGNGQQFSISQLSFNAVSSDPGNGLGFGYAGGYSYGSGYVGVINGPGGPTYVTGGSDTQLVDELFARGSGNSYPAYCSSCTLAEQQAAIDAVAAYPGYNYTFTGTYTLGDVSGSGTFNISAVPEPSTWAMMILGFFGLGFMGYRRRAKLASAIA